MTTSATNTSSTPLTATGLTSSGEQNSKADQAKQAASVARDEAKQVGSDVRAQARGLMNETRTQVEDQSRTQRDRLVETIRTFSDDLDNMAEQRGGLASDAAREVANRARSISQQLDGREPAELLDDLRSFARRRPGMFLAGSVFAGVFVGRILRGSREAAQTGSWGGSSSTSDVAVTQESPLATPYDTTMTAPVPAPIDDPLTSPLASPAVTSNESGRPVGGL